MANDPDPQPDPLEKSLGDQATGADVSRVDRDMSLGDQATGADFSPPDRDLSLGDQSTTGDALSSISDLSDLSDDLGDEMPLVDLSERYEIQDVLGKGGMGEVLRALDKRLKRPVAIKRVLGEMARSKKALSRFLTEAQSIAALNHFNIVQIYDYGRDAEGPFIIMELVEGESLLDKLKAGPLEIEEAVDITCQLCEALGKAHGAGIVHRDIKPANILLTEDGAPKLTDFGLARQDTADHGQTQAGAVLGTIDFMPPEQRRDATATDARSDLWSLAATLYQMVTGKSPKVIRLDQVAESLRPVLGQALEEDPTDRFQDSASFREALKRALAKQQAATQSLAEDELVEGCCGKCGVVNDLDRKFCKSCAAPLREPCLACESENAVWEQICGECGGNLPELIAARKKEIIAQKGAVESLRRQYRYEEAIDQLGSLLVGDHPRFSTENAWIEETVRALESEHQQQRKRCQPIFDSAGKELANHKFAEAIKLLQAIPAALRDREILDLLKQSQSNQQEKERLAKEIKEQMASKELTGLLVKANRFLELAPGHPQIMKLQGQLLSRQKKVTSQGTAVLERAEKLYSEQQDEDVLKVLSHWPSGLQQPARAAELYSLASDRIASASQPIDLGSIPVEMLGTRNRPAINLRGKRRKKLTWQHPWVLASIGAGVVVLIMLILQLFNEFIMAPYDEAFDFLENGDRPATEKPNSNDGENETKPSSEIDDGQSTTSPDVAGEGKTIGLATLTLTGHSLSVESVAFSPNGKWIVTGSRDMTLKLWDAETGEEMRTLTGHTDYVNSAFFSPDGKRIVSGSADKTVKLWDTETGQEILTLNGHTRQVTSVEFSPDGKRIVSGSRDGMVKVWNADTGQQMRTLAGHSADVWSVAFSPDGKQIGSGGGDKVVKIWDTATGQEMLTLQGHSGDVWSVAFSPDGKRIVSSGGALKVWDSVTGQETLTLGGDSREDHQFGGVFSPDGKRIVSGSRDGMVKVWNADTGQQMRTLAGHSSVAILSVAFSPDGQRIVSGSWDQTIKVWNVESVQPTVSSTRTERPRTAGAPFDATQAKALQQAWGTYLGVPVETTNSIGMKLVLIPPGVFQMGTSPASSEEPVHRATLTKAYYLSSHEITQSQYEQVVGRNPSSFKGLEYPVEKVSWRDGVAFCISLGELSKEKQQGFHYRLPTSAEWEHACRSGATTAYGFGDDPTMLAQYGWSSENSRGQTHPVGQKQPNRWGLYDIHGNVWEWCSDWQQKYSPDAVVDPQGPKDGVRRVLRGGSFSFTADRARSGVQDGARPEESARDWGFRVILEVSTTPAKTTSTPPVAE